MKNLKEKVQQKNGISRVFSKPVYISHQIRIVIILSLIAFFFKCFLLYERSLFIDPDEGYYLILARNLITGNGYTFNGLPNIVFPPFLPILIVFFYLICQDFQFSLIFITAISGALLGIISYRIARKKFSSLVPVLCAFLVLFIYQLNAFLPILSPYLLNLYRGSDILNCFLIFSSIYFAICLMEKDKYIFAILAGAFFAFSYLTRPEGFLLFMIIFICFIFLRIKSLIFISYKKLLVFFFIFVLFSFPYILYLKNTTGKWSLSGKIYSVQQHRESLLEVIKNDNWGPFSKVHYSFDKKSMEMNHSYWGFHDNIKANNKISLQSFLINIFENLKMYYIIPKILFPLYLIVFFLLGFANAVYKIVKRKSSIDIILFMLFPYSLLITALAYPIPRHHLFLVPVLCIYAVEGIILISSSIAKNKNAIKKILLILISLIVIIFIGYDYQRNFNKNYLNIPSFRKSLLVNSYLSQYLKNKKAQTIMSVHPSFAVRTSSDWQVLPATQLPDIIKFGKHKNADYIILPDPDGKSYFYYIIDIKNSYIPEDLNDEFGYLVIEVNKYFNLLNLVNKE